jgi:Flp pilus assembly pilin Flp
MLRVCVWLQIAMSDGLRQIRQTRGVRTATQLGDERGQTTAEYALVILAAAAIAIVLIAWARSSGKLPAFFDHIIDQITSGAS